MRKFIMRRLFFSIFVLIGVSLIVFLIIYLAPGDPAQLILGDTATPEQIAQKRAELGLDQPMWKQYLIYIFGVLQGDLGTSLYYNMPCSTIILPMLWNTVILSFSSMLLALLIAIPLGVIAGTRPGSFSDFAATTFSMFGQACSSVWLGLALILIFSVKLGWLPAYGDISLSTLIMPSITLGTPMAALLVRIVRAGMIDTLSEDYILAARAKGEPEFRIVMRYAMKNVMLPVITIVGLNFGAFLGGAVVTEQIFSWNGVGRLMVSSIYSRDYPMVQSCLLLSSFLFVMVTLIVDILYTWVDPRVRLDSGRRKRKIRSMLNNSDVSKQELTVEKGA